MPKKKEIGNLTLTGYDALFSSTVNATTAEPTNTHDPNSERVVEIPLAELHSPEFHPFHVNEDEAMERLAANIKQYGVREPGLARPRADGGYELLAGNRRKRACEIAERPTLPVIIREMTDDGVTNIEISDKNIKDFEGIARKYGVDFAVVKDATESPPKHLVFFKARDSDAIGAAFKEYSAKSMAKSGEKPSLLGMLRDLMEKVKDQILDQTKHKDRGRDL